MKVAGVEAAAPRRSGREGGSRGSTLPPRPPSLPRQPRASVPGASCAPPRSPDTLPPPTSSQLAPYLGRPRQGASQAPRAGPRLPVVPNQRNSRPDRGFFVPPRVKIVPTGSQPTRPRGREPEEIPSQPCGRPSLLARLALGWPWMNESSRSACLGLCQEPGTAPCSLLGCTPCLLRVPPLASV